MGTNFILFVMMLACLSRAVWEADRNADKATKGDRFRDIALVILSAIGLVISIVNLMLF